MCSEDVTWKTIFGRLTILAATPLQFGTHAEREP